MPMHHRAKRCSIPFAMGLVAFAFASVAHAQSNEGVTFSDQVVRIFQQSCQQCHHEGTGAPMSLMTFEEARPWAKSIKNKVSKREMPPWHADPRYGKFVNDRRLSEEEIETIVRWVDTGARRGDPKKLPEPIEFTEGWSIGEPDLVLSMRRPYTVRASGRDTFEYFQIDTGLAEDRFVSAVEIMPGDRRVVHHVLCYVHQNDNFDFRDEQSWAGSIGDGGTMLIEYAVGNRGDIFPPGTGRLLKKGSWLLLQIHYHPYGEQTQDVTSVGLRFHPRGTENKRVISRWIGTQSLSIPPNTKNVRSQSSYTFRRPVNIISFQPHMHCRGQAMTAEAFYPNGEHEILCSVPHYDFNWQTTYTFTEPPYLPAGTRLQVTAMHDNTADNPNNPNPNTYVSWGQSTFEEMMHGWTDFVYADEEGEWPGASTAGEVARRRAQPVTRSEPPRQAVARLEQPAPAAQPQPAPLHHLQDPTTAPASDVRTQPTGIRSAVVPGALGLAIALGCVALLAGLFRRFA